KSKRFYHAGDRLSALRIFGKSIIVKEKIFYLREQLPSEYHFLINVLFRSHAVSMPGDCLGPQAVCAPGSASPACAEGKVWVEQIADIIIFNRKIPRINLGYKRKRAEILDQGSVRCSNKPLFCSIDNAVDTVKRYFGSYFYDGIIILSRGGKIQA